MFVLFWLYTSNLQIYQAYRCKDLLRICYRMVSVYVYQDIIKIQSIFVKCTLWTKKLFIKILLIVNFMHVDIVDLFSRKFTINNLLNEHLYLVVLYIWIGLWGPYTYMLDIFANLMCIIKTLGYSEQKCWPHWYFILQPVNYYKK
jgi:hypothetical protein